MCWKSTIIFHLKNSPYCTNLMYLYRIKLSLKYQFLNLLTLDFHYFPLLIAVEVELSDGRQNTGNSQLWGELVVSGDRKMFRLPISTIKRHVAVQRWGVNFPMDTISLKAKSIYRGVIFIAVSLELDKIKYSSTGALNEF